jgi:transcription-repair coupling factor (superfamily II helicase)
LKELKVEMIDRFGLLPESTQNLFESSSLKNLSQEVGILKVNIYDDKAEITLNDSSSIDVSKIINLIQTKPQKFQLKNQKTIVIKEDMEADQLRIRKITDILKSLI